MTLRPLRSTTPTVLLPSSATKRRCRARSMAMWSIRPLTLPSGILASSLSPDVSGDCAMAWSCATSSASVNAIIAPIRFGMKSILRDLPPKVDLSRSGLTRRSKGGAPGLFVRSATGRFAGCQVVERCFRCVALHSHYLEDGLPVADLFLHGEHRPLRRSLLDDRGDCHLGHGQQRVILRRPCDMLEVGKHFLFRSPAGCSGLSAILIEGVVFRGSLEALRRGVDRQHELAVLHLVFRFCRHLGALGNLRNPLRHGHFGVAYCS